MGNNPMNIASKVNSPFAAIIFEVDSEGKPTVSLSMDTSTGRPDYFISLTAKKPMEDAMSITINIAYVPSAAGKEPKDPNLIDRLLIKYGGECYLQWGWGDKAGGLTPLSKCLITGYTSSFNGGYLNYTLTGVAFAVKYNYDRLQVNTSGKTPYEVIKYVYDKSELKEHYVLDKNMETVLKDTVSSMKGSTNNTPIKFLNDYAKTIKVKSEANKVKGNPSEDYFVVVVDDSTFGNSGSNANKGTIYIRRITPKTMIGNASDGSVITFNWNSIGTKKNSSNEVLDWKPSYDGSCMIFAGQETYLKELDENSDEYKKLQETLDEQSVVNSVSFNDGKAAISFSSGAKPTVSPQKDFFQTSSLRGACQTSINAQWWAKHLGQYAYNATLKVQGQPELAQVGVTVFYVQPLIGTQEHHTAGYYLVTGVTDEINSSGFTTTYELVKLGYSIDKNGDIRYSTTLGFNPQQDDTGYMIYNGKRLSIEAYEKGLIAGIESDTSGAETGEESGEAYSLTCSNCTTSYSGDLNTIPAGTEIQVTANAAASGFVFDSFTVKGAEINMSLVSDNTYKFTMPSSSITVEATYKQQA